MPGSSIQQFIFAAFLAPATTVSNTGVQVAFSDPRFQVVEAYNTNNQLAAGRLVTRNNVTTSYSVGPVDFIVRGWSANAGTTWQAALATWNNGSPLEPMFIGSSIVGNDLWIAGDLPMWPLFGIGQDQGQVPGFDMSLVPEPSSLVLAGLCLAALWSGRTQHERRGYSAAASASHRNFTAKRERVVWAW